MRWFEVLILLSAAVGFISGQSSVRASPANAKPTVTSTASGSKQSNDIADDDPSAAGWLAYKAVYGKKYSSSVEDTLRQALRENNLQKIQEHNDEVKHGMKRYKLGGNKFLDATPAEYQLLLGYKPPTETSARRKRRSIPAMPTYTNTVNVATLPATVNWTASGLDGPVMDQGQCGSCWAYSSTGAIEAQYKKKTTTWAQMSEQNLIDCSFPQGNHGCSGGSINYAFWYVQTNGLDSLASYPDVSGTTRVNGTCNYSSLTRVTNITAWNKVASANENALQQAVALVGPVSVAVNASLQSFQYYKSGVYSPTDCAGAKSNLNHAVLVVGYGVSGSQPYWLVKNSWGTSWGMNGYMMIARNNTCGIATYPSFPVL